MGQADSDQGLGCGGGGGGKTVEDGAVISHGNYLSAVAEIGKLEHCFTRDLLNHLVFVQKVFMREVNDVVQKMSGGERPVPVWTEFGLEDPALHENAMMASSSGQAKRLLFSISVKLKSIRIMALTPANAGVRFETGTSELQISNRQKCQL